MYTFTKNILFKLDMMRSRLAKVPTYCFSDVQIDDLYLKNFPSISLYKAPLIQSHNPNSIILSLILTLILYQGSL